MKLSELCKYDTDKFDLGYVDHIYNDLFSDRDVKKVLEIGVLRGGSILLWHEWFANAEIHGVDVRKCAAIVDKPRIVMHVANAYTKEFVHSLPNDFDIIIDDGPHSIDSQKFFLTNYISKLNKGGLLVLEDVIHGLKDVAPSIPENFDYVKVHNMAGKQKTESLFNFWSNWQHGLYVVVIKAALV